MYVMIRHSVIKEDALSAMKEGYEADVMAPVVASKGNRLFCVFNSVEREREVRHITGWDSKEDCDRFLTEVLPPRFSKWEWVFERKPETSFWDLRLPGKLQFDPLTMGNSATYIRASRFKWKPEGVPVMQAAYEPEIMGPAVNSRGNRFFFVLLSTEEDLVGIQVTGWGSKEDCDRWLREVWPKGYEKRKWAFEEPPVATFWELRWPARIQF